MIVFDGLVKRFGTKPVLDGIDLTIPRGTLQFVIGTSGAGKSVLMKHVVGLVRADAGRVLFEGQDITNLAEKDFYEVRRRCGFVFQHSTLFDSMTIAGNVALAIRKRYDLGAAESLERAAAELERLHLTPFAAKLPSEVGAGVRKRAAIARALSLDPRCVIYDEPTTGLDPVAARRVDKLIEQLRERGVTQVVVSHDLISIFSIADRVAMIFGGKVHVEGAPEELRGSADPVVKQFLAGSPEGPI